MTVMGIYGSYDRTRVLSRQYPSPLLMAQPPHKDVLFMKNVNVLAKQLLQKLNLKCLSNDGCVSVQCFYIAEQRNAVPEVNSKHMCQATLVHLLDLNNYLNPITYGIWNFC